VGRRPAFQAAAQAGDLAAAIDLYAGELLPEDRFEPWAERHREQLGARFSRLLLERAAELEAAGDQRGAAGALERLTAVDPLNEPAATGLMRAYALAGQRHLAMGRYRQLEERLAEELGVEPGAPAAPGDRRRPLPAGRRAGRSRGAGPAGGTAGGGAQARHRRARGRHRRAGRRGSRTCPAGAGALGGAGVRGAAVVGRHRRAAGRRLGRGRVRHPPGPRGRRGPGPACRAGDPGPLAAAGCGWAWPPAR